MRGWSSGATLGVAAGLCALAVLGLIFVSGPQRETGASTFILEISDTPATLARNHAEEAEVVATLPGAEEPPFEEEVAEKPAVQEKLFIADTLRLKLSDPVINWGAHADDLAAVEAFYNAHNGPALWMTTTGISSNGKAILEEITRAGEWGLDPASFTVPPPHYQPATAGDQAATEIALSLAILKYARHARGGRADPSSLNKLIDQTPPLRDPEVVLAEIAVAEMPDAYLRNLHPEHAQFAQLRQALLKARAQGGTSKDESKILINMQRWRWMPEDLGSVYVWLNTPEFMMRIVKGGKAIHSEKIVVGKPVYATPVFSAKMTSIVFNPRWTVPPTIVREDLLPKLRRGRGGWFGGGNTAILKQHKLKVLYKGREVDAGRIDWNNVSMSAIRFTQEPGPTNVLGKVKFLYPNKHIVYMHDTIKRDLLKKEVRAEGHHCPRVANPGTVAAVLLAEDKGWAKSKIDHLMNKGYDAAVALDNPIPVHTTYFTAVASPDGKVSTYSDIYNLDDSVFRAVISKENVPPPTSSALDPPWNREDNLVELDALTPSESFGPATLHRRAAQRCYSPKRWFGISSEFWMKLQAR